MELRQRRSVSAAPRWTGRDGMVRDGVGRGGHYSYASELIFQTAVSNGRANYRPHHYIPASSPCTFCVAFHMGQFKQITPTIEKCALRDIEQVIKQYNMLAERGILGPSYVLDHCGTAVLMRLM